MDRKSDSLLATSQQTIVSFYSIFHLSFYLLCLFALSVSMYSMFVSLCLCLCLLSLCLSLSMCLSLSNCLSLCPPPLLPHTQAFFLFSLCVKRMAIIWPRQLAPLSHHDSFDISISILLHILVLAFLHSSTVLVSLIVLLALLALLPMLVRLVCTKLCQPIDLWGTNEMERGVVVARPRWSLVHGDGEGALGCNSTPPSAVRPGSLASDFFSLFWFRSWIISFMFSSFTVSDVTLRDNVETEPGLMRYG